MKWGVCVFFEKKWKMGGVFTKKVDLSSTQGALFTVSVFFIFAFYLLGGCIRTQRTALPTGVDVVYWGGGIHGYTAYTNLRGFLIAYTHLSDHK